MGGHFDSSQSGIHILCNLSAAMAPLPNGFTYGQWSAVYNAPSFSIAGMGSATIFFWLQLPNLTKNYRTALIITGLVTAIATYHYVRIFNSWVAAFDVKNTPGADYSVAVSGTPFNDAYRYVDWLLTVPLLLIELILVMKLPKAETVELGWKLGVASAVMMALGYPGEIQDDPQTRWVWWALAMMPFLYVVKNLGLAGSVATTYEQVGYSIADVVAKAVFGVLIWAIGAGKSAEEENGLIPK